MFSSEAFPFYFLETSDGFFMQKCTVSLLAEGTREWKGCGNLFYFLNHVFVSFSVNRDSAVYSFHIQWIYLQSYNIDRRFGQSLFDGLKYASYRGCGSINLAITPESIE
jgi:hypothetical protein